MTLLSTTEDFSQSSGVINFTFLDNLYESFTDEGIQMMGQTITVHLQPAIKEDAGTQAATFGGQQYNPFFGQAVRPNPSTRRTGVQVTPRDIPFTAHVVVGPREEPTVFGTPLKANQCQTTTVLSSQSYIEDAISVTILSKRYRLSDGPRPVGLVTKKYLICTWEEISEVEAP